MTTINQLSRASALSGSDVIPLFQSNQGDTRSVSLTQVAAYVQTAIEGDPDETVYSITTNGSGFTVAVLPATIGGSVWGQFTLSGAFAAGTLILPGIDDRANGQEVLLTFTQAVAALTINGNGASVAGAPTSLSANGFFKLKYDSISSTWYRVG